MCLYESVVVEDQRINESCLIGVYDMKRILWENVVDAFVSSKRKVVKALLFIVAMSLSLSLYATEYEYYWQSINNSSGGPFNSYSAALADAQASLGLQEMQEPYSFQTLYAGGREYRRYYLRGVEWYSFYNRSHFNGWAWDSYHSMTASTPGGVIANILAEAPIRCASYMNGYILNVSQNGSYSSDSNSVPITVLFSGFGNCHGGNPTEYADEIRAKRVGVTIESRHYAEYYITSIEDNGQPADCVADPCDPATGKMFLDKQDYISEVSGLSFSRYYQSKGARDGGGVIGENWNHNYSRSLDSFSTADEHASKVVTKSSTYGSPQSACSSGWSEIKSQGYRSLLGAGTAVYTGDSCEIQVNGETELVLPVHKYDRRNADDIFHVYMKSVTRSNGDVIYFTEQNGEWVNTETTNVGLVEVIGEDGQTLAWQFIDADGSIETYDLAGNLTQVQSPTRQLTGLTYDETTGYLDTITGPFGRTLTFTYTLDGRVDTLTTPDGMIDYDYDAAGNLRYVTYPGSHVTEYRYEDVNYPHSMTSHYNENGELHATWQYYSDGKVQFNELGSNGVARYEFSYNADGTTTVTEPLGSTQTYTFELVNGSMRVKQIEGPPCSDCNNLNTLESYVYNDDGTIQSETDRNGNTTHYLYNARGLETSRTINVEGVDETTLTHWHPDYPLMSCLIQPQRTTIYAYYSSDEDALLQSRTEVDTSDAVLFPDSASKECDSVLARGDYASLNTRTWSYTYDANNLLETVDGPRTDVVDVTTYTHDPANGNLLSIENALGHLTQITLHDANGRPMRTVDPNGQVTQLTYTSRGWADLIKVGTDSTYETTDLDYYPTGLLEKVTLPDGRYLRYIYDSAHRLVDIYDQNNNHIHYVLDDMGNRTDVEIKDPNGVLKGDHTYVFNTLSRLTTSLGADIGLDTQVFYYDKYDGNGNLKETRDTLNNITQYQYDALNRLKTVVDALNGTTSYGYDSMGQLETVVDANNNTTTYDYDGLGNLIQLDSPDTGVTNYTLYDHAGNLKSETDADGQTTTYEYDALNRLTTTTYHDGTTRVHAYDTAVNGIGRLESVTEQSSVVSYGYDLLGRVTEKVQTIGSRSFSVYYGYNAVGQLDLVTYPSGQIVDLDYLNGQLKHVKVNGVIVIDDIEHAPFGSLQGWAMGVNGPSTNRVSRIYDLDGQLESYSLGSATKQLSYYSTGNISGMLDLNDATLNQSFDYDELYRLTDYNGFGQTHIYGYDANGNRNSYTLNGTPYNLVVNPQNNRLNSAAGPAAKTYGYDNVGNITSDGIHTYQYDVRNRFVGVNGNEMYTHNGLGQRVSKATVFVDAANLAGDANNDGVIDSQDSTLVLNHILGQQTVSNGDCNEDYAVNVSDLVCIQLKSANQSVTAETYFVYDERGQLIGEYNAQGGAMQETVYLENLPILVLKNEGVYYIHADHLNTPRAITDAANTVYWSWASDPFGTTLADSDVDGDGNDFIYNLRFPGQYYDEETGLHYNYFRDYDPSTGRYVQSDPIGLEGGLNTYAYVGGNPLKKVDPSGEGPISGWGVMAFCDGYAIGGNINTFNDLDNLIQEVEQLNELIDTAEGACSSDKRPPWFQNRIDKLKDTRLRLLKEHARKSSSMLPDTVRHAVYCAAAGAVATILPTP